MAVDVSVSMYIGAAIAGVSLVIYLAGMLYPSKVGNADEANKIFAWAALAAFANLVLQTNLLADMGQYLRWDGLEFNYERWIINSICMLFLGLAATCYGWHDLIHGYWAVFSGVLCAVAMIFAGMTSNEARWVWFIYGLTAGFVSFYFGFFKACLLFFLCFC